MYVKKKKYFIIIFIVLLALTVAFEKPILYSYYTFRSVEIETVYSDDLLLFNNDIETADKSEYIQYAELSNGIQIILPNATDILTFNLESNKSNSENFQTCFTYDDNYCLLFRLSKRHFPLNNKTHKYDKLIFLNNDGSESVSFKSSAEEWILDYIEGEVLIYNSKENSFYYKDIDSNISQKITINYCDNYSKVILSCDDSVWKANFYNNDKLVFEKTVSKLN